MHEEEEDTCMRRRRIHALVSTRVPNHMTKSSLVCMKIGVSGANPSSLSKISNRMKKSLMSLSPLALRYSLFTTLSLVLFYY